MNETERARLGVDAAYLHYQYDDTQKFRTRVEAHELYSDRPGSFREWLLEQLAPDAGMSVLDVGCGPGTYHAALASSGARITACDVSDGMLDAVVRQATEQGFRVEAVRASAEALPFADGAFDLVMANHMLYHVADQLGALSEMRRVLRAGGRAVMATNAAENCARIDALHDAAARSLGYTPAVSDALRFTLDDLALVRAVFPSARVLVREDAFLFPTAGAAVRYYASYMIDSIEDRPDDGSHRPPLAQAVTAAVEAVIAREGVFRVPKIAGCFLAER